MKWNVMLHTSVINQLSPVTHAGAGVVVARLGKSPIICFFFLVWLAAMEKYYQRKPWVSWVELEVSDSCFLAKTATLLKWTYVSTTSQLMSRFLWDVLCWLSTYPAHRLPVFLEPDQCLGTAARAGCGTAVPLPCVAITSLLVELYLCLHINTHMWLSTLQLYTAGLLLHFTVAHLCVSVPVCRGLVPPEGDVQGGGWSRVRPH